MGRAGTAPKSTGPKASTESTDSTDSTDSPTSGAEPAACDLITERDASAAFGEPVTNGEHRNDECSWYSKNDLKTVNVIRRSGEVDEWRRGYQNDTWKKIDLGDEAYRSKALDSITFRLSETTYEVNVVFSTKGDPETIVNDLAKKVYSRL